MSFFVEQYYRRRVQPVGPEPSATKQSFKGEADINNIMSRYRRTGLVNYVSRYAGQYGDIPALDFHEAQNVLLRARQMYDELPAELRRRFPGPGEFLDWIQDAGKRSEHEAAGLVPKRAATESPPAADLEGGPGGTGA